MILDVYGEVLLTMLEGHSFRQRPRLQYASKFQPKIIMKPGCCMLLDDKFPTSRAAVIPPWLWSFLAVSFAMVGRQRHRSCGFAAGLAFSRSLSGRPSRACFLNALF